MRIAKDNKIKTFTVLLLEDLLSAGKISKAIEKVISLKLFGELMKNSENISESAVLSLMSKLEVDFSVAKSQFQEYCAALTWIFQGSAISRSLALQMLQLLFSAINYICGFPATHCLCAPKRHILHVFGPRHPDRLHGIFNLLSSTDRHTNHIPVSVAFAVSWSLNTQQLNSLKISELLKQFHTHESSLFSTTLSASSFGLNLCSVEEPSSAMMELGLQHENQDLQQTNKDFDEQTIALWIYEFERTLTYKNLELALLTLKLFVERKGAADEWLFMYQEEQLKNALSCALLKVACKVVPFLAEIDSSIRDFVNCGFITALQSCTDSFSNLSTEKNLLSTFSILCLKLHHVYDNCIKLNMDNQDYSDIKQEWREFFGPSQLPLFLGGLWICIKMKLINITPVSSLSLGEDGEESTKYFNGYPCNLSALLSRAFPLFFHKQPHIQLASAKISRDQSLQPQETKHLPTFFADLLAQQVNLDDQEDEKDSQIQAFSSSKQDRQPSGPAIDPLLLGWDVIVRFLAELDVLSTRNGQEVDDLFKEPMNHSNSTAFDATHFVCHLYYKSLIVMPALVRQWYHH
uniref:E3 ubiquitin-protein ligase listerin HEAT-repeats region domain-containing protein n=1 Tax=Ditylenchus dipsaci TaxID=166011 RepID=A0A915D5P2_9BILA